MVSLNYYFGHVDNHLNSSFFSHLDHDEVFNALASLDEFYPDFYSWFYKTVVPGALSGERKILTEFHDGELSAVAIIKNTQEEKKLCNLTVLPKFQNKGIGLRLFKRVFEDLGSETPFLTVSEEKYSEFKRLFDHYGFEVTSVKEGVYRTGKLEFFLNERNSNLS